jgi:Carbohydrate family 9 binding domain-like
MQKMSRMTIIMSVILALGILASPALSQDNDDAKVKARLGAMVKELGHMEFARRQAATEKAKALPYEEISLLVDMLEASDDPELHYRAKLILKEKVPDGAILVKRVRATPKIDGKLDDKAWKVRPTIHKFRDLRTKGIPRVRTQVWLTFDDKNLYVAARCYEPNVEKIRTTIHERDGVVTADDCIEFFLDTNSDGATYWQIAVNSVGAIFDGYKTDGAKSLAITAAGAKGNGYWSMELAIPWSELGFDKTPNGKAMRYLVTRNRPAAREHMQFPPIGQANHSPHLFGEMKIGK